VMVCQEINQSRGLFNHQAKHSNIPTLPHDGPLPHPFRDMLFALPFWGY